MPRNRRRPQKHLTLAVEHARAPEAKKRLRRAFELIQRAAGRADEKGEVKPEEPEDSDTGG